MVEDFNRVYDALNKVCIIYTDAYNISYLEALILVLEDLSYSDNLDNLRINNEKIKDAYRNISGFFNNEDLILNVYKSLTLKGLEDGLYALDLLVPEVISFLAGYLILRIFIDQYYLQIYDSNLKIGSFLDGLRKILIYKEVTYYGYEKDELLLKYANGLFNYQMVDLININKETEDIYFDCITSNTDGIENIYEHILCDLKRLKDDGYFIYLIDDNFFKNENFKSFNEQLIEESSLLGLVTLPVSLFNSIELRKSLLVGRKKRSQKDLVVVTLPDHIDEENLQIIINMLDEFSHAIKEEDF